MRDKDSIGCVVACVCRNVPTGLGEPCFDKLEALLAHAMLSIPATKGFDWQLLLRYAQRQQQHDVLLVNAAGSL
jgi:chorismate synthase